MRLAGPGLTRPGELILTWPLHRPAVSRLSGSCDPGGIMPSARQAGSRVDDKRPRSVIPKSGGVFHEVATRIKLIVRLMRDRRVNPLVKLLPVGALAYWLIPDMAPGPIDDALLMWLGTYLFVELCPPEVVQEHLRDADRRSSTANGAKCLPKRRSNSTHRSSRSAATTGRL